MSTRPIRTLGLFWLVLIAALMCPGQAASQVVLFENGRWFDGESFVTGSRYCVDGVFREGDFGTVDKRVDLEGGYVVPAFGDAHNHNISRPPREGELEKYIAAGVFYALILNNMTWGDPAAPVTDPVSVAYANGGFTAPGGHVIELHEKLVDYGVIPLEKEQLDGVAFFTVETPEDLDRRWADVLAGKPDIIKVYLGRRFEGAPHLADEIDPFGKVGLDPALLPDIVERAHAAGLRVAAHIETAPDFREAVAAGVDIVAHLPGWRVGHAAGIAQGSPDFWWWLTEADASAAAEAGTVVITTVLAGEATLDPAHPDHREIRANHKRNLETLRAAGVRLVLGSDFYGGTAVTEALYLSSEPVLQGVEPLGVFDNSTLVRMLGMDTPRAIFPDRSVGGLGPGFEATFLVLEGDPVESLANLARISQRYHRARPVAAPSE